MMYDFIAALVAHTGQPATVFVGPSALAKLAQDASGNLSITHWDASLGVEPTVEQLIAILSAPPTKARLKAIAAEKRFAVETGGIVAGGAQIDTSRDSQNMISNADRYAQASGVASVRYKAASGWIEIAAAPLHAAALAVGAHVQACFDLEYAIDTAIDAGTITTSAEIYDPASAGLPAWPANS